MLFTPSKFLAGEGIEAAVGCSCRTASEARIPGRMGRLVFLFDKGPNGSTRVSPRLGGIGLMSLRAGERSLLRGSTTTGPKGGGETSFGDMPRPGMARLKRTTTERIRPGWAWTEERMFMAFPQGIPESSRGAG